MPRPRLAGFTASRSAPSRVIVPAVGSTKPAIICRVVVLPQPDGPRSERNSPFSMLSERLSTTATAPYRFVSPSRTRKLIAAVAPPSPLDLARPTLVPFFAMLVHGVPVDHLELVHLLRPVGNAGALLGWQLHILVDGAEPGAAREHRLRFGAQEVLDETLRLGLIGRTGDRASGNAERDAALLGISERGGKAGIGERLGAARPPDGDDG